MLTVPKIPKSIGAKAEWVVTGGEGKGGIVVSLGKSPGSKELPERLATGSLVEQREMQGKWLRYMLVAGSGPQRGWVSSDGLAPLAGKGENIGGILVTPRKKASTVPAEEDMVEQLQARNVQVFDLRKRSVVDQDFVDIVSAKEKAVAEAERQRQAMEIEAMCWEDAEAEQVRRLQCQAAEEAEAEKVKAERLREMREREREAMLTEEAAAAMVRKRRDAGQIPVLVHVNRSLKIQVEFWVDHGAKPQAVKEAFAEELSRKFTTVRLDPANVALQYCDGQPLVEGDAIVAQNCDDNNGEDEDDDETVQQSGGVRDMFVQLEIGRPRGPEDQE